MAGPIDEQLIALGTRRMNADTEPAELVLPAQSEERLGWIAAWLTQPPQVWAEWGLHHFIDGGFRALFRGPPGTGKTMAAIALAQGTGRALFHVDLGAIMSNYVGETEKTLQRIFEAAEKDGAILLFNEADALFGKRGEVGDSHDRYANLKVADLLRRIEPYEGLAILATNRTGNIDDALGRIDVIVDFPMPDEAARKELWRKLLGAVKL